MQNSPAKKQPLILEKQNILMVAIQYQKVKLRLKELDFGSVEIKPLQDLMAL